MSWGMVKLADLGRIVTGNTPSTSNKLYFCSNDIPFYKPNDFAEDSVNTLACSQNYVSENARDVCRIIPINSVMVTCIGIIGKVGISTSECTCNQQINAIVPDRKICNSRYLAYSLWNMRQQLRNIANAPVVPIINKSQFSEVQIHLPPLDVQKQIADTLDKASSLIELRKTQLEKMDLLIKSKFIEMFGDKSHFATVPLIDIIIDGAGLSYGIVQPGDDGTGDMGVLRPVDIVKGELDINKIKYIDSEIGFGYKRTQLTGNELLITVRGTTGLTALTDERFCNMNVTRGIAVIRYNKSMVNKFYLNEFFQSDESQRYIQEHTQGATLRQINLSDLRNMHVSLPPLSLQDQFAEFVRSSKKQKELMLIGFKKIETVYKALTQGYFGCEYEH